MARALERKDFDMRPYMCTLKTNLVDEAKSEFKTLTEEQGRQKAAQPSQVPPQGRQKAMQIKGNKGGAKGGGKEKGKGKGKNWIQVGNRALEVRKFIATFVRNQRSPCAPYIKC